MSRELKKQRDKQILKPLEGETIIVYFRAEHTQPKILFIEKIGYLGHGEVGFSVFNFIDDVYDDDWKMWGMGLYAAKKLVKNKMVTFDEPDIVTKVEIM